MGSLIPTSDKLAHDENPDLVRASRRRIEGWYSLSLRCDRAAGNALIKRTIRNDRCAPRLRIAKIQAYGIVDRLGRQDQGIGANGPRRVARLY